MRRVRQTHQAPVAACHAGEKLIQDLKKSSSIKATRVTCANSPAVALPFLL